MADRAAGRGLVVDDYGQLGSGSSMMSAMTATTESRPALAAAPASPPASRQARRVWRDPRLVVGLALVALSVVLGAWLLGAADDTVDVWATRTAMSAGMPLGPADLVRREIRFGSQDEADRYLPANVPLPTGATMRRAVGAGELLPRAALSGAPHTALTEVPLSVATDAVPATLRVGSVVDVWVAPDSGAPAGDGPKPARAALVFDDVRVVAAPRGATTLGPSATRQVIVGLDGRQQADLPEALAQLSGGRVLLTRRH
jgi:hypothetical protein